MPNYGTFLGMAPSLHGDLTGDGLADLLLSNQRTDGGDPVVYLFTPPFTAEMTADDAHRVYYPPQVYTPTDPDVGSDARYVGDLDGDGFFTFESTFSEDPSVCYLVQGLGGGERVSLIDWMSLSPCDAPLAMGPDFDGDDARDLAIASSTDVLWFSHATGGDLTPDDATRVQVWQSSGTSSVWGYPTDFDEDGVEDLVTYVHRTGAADELDVLFGPMDALSTSSRRFVFLPADSDDIASVLRPGDFNGDGHPDLVVLDIPLDLQSEAAEVWLDLFEGPLTSGVFGASDADARIRLPIDNPLFITFDVGDIDGDGYDDIALGHLGYAWVIYGQGR